MPDHYDSPMPGAYAAMLAEDHEAGVDVFAFDRRTPLEPEPPRPQIPPPDWGAEARTKGRPPAPEPSSVGEAPDKHARAHR
jgi:hypothetical protein